jgi:hypothetical protein
MIRLILEHLKRYKIASAGDDFASASRRKPEKV